MQTRYLLKEIKVVRENGSDLIRADYYKDEDLYRHYATKQSAVQTLIISSVAFQLTSLNSRLIAQEVEKYFLPYILQVEEDEPEYEVLWPAEFLCEKETRAAFEARQKVAA